MNKPISDCKREANRNNAKRSTGPRTQAGKNRSRYNALTHGLTAKVLLTRGESEKELQDYFRRVRDDLRPKGFMEEIRVEDAVAASWRLRRVALFEGAWVDKQMGHAKTTIDRNAAALPEKQAFTLAARYDSKHRGIRDRSLKDLERLQALRKREQREQRQMALQENLPDQVAARPKPPQQKDESGA